MQNVKLVINKSRDFPFVRRFDNDTGSYRYVYLETPKDGWWKLVWCRKPKHEAKSITDFILKEEAEILANKLNRMPAKMAHLLVKTIICHGRTLQAEFEKNRSSRPFSSQ